MFKRILNLRNVTTIVVCLVVTTVFEGCSKAENPQTYEKGVVINGVKWATRNVDDIGTFADNSKAKGKLYQWNRKKAWQLTKHWDSTPDWDRTFPSGGTTWEEINDPSPAGWRVPTKEEIESLLDENKVSRKRIQEGGSFIGIYNFEGVLFTDKTTGNTLLLPSTGQIIGSTDDGLQSATSYGHYWSSTSNPTYYNNELGAYLLEYMPDGDLYGTNVGLKVIECRYGDRNHGYAIRSVSK